MKEAIENRKRDTKGRYIGTVEGGWKTKQPEYQKVYLLTHPWAKHWQYSKGRAKRKGWKHTLKVADFKALWDRDNAHRLTNPSIDRINPKKGYIKENCRFIERSENSARAQRGRASTEKQRIAASNNLKNYKKLNPIPWNKL